MTITTIPVSREFHDWLKSQGKKGESYEEIIKRLLKLDLQKEPDTPKQIDNGNNDANSDKDSTDLF